MTNPIHATMLRAAEEAQRMGRLDMAEAQCRQILSDDPDFLPAKQMLGIIAAQTGRGPLAADTLREVLEKDPNAAEAARWLSALLVNSEQLGEARHWAERAVESQPDSPDSHFTLGRCLLAMQDFSQAAACFQRAIEGRPDFAVAHHNLGLAMLQLGRRSEAEAAFRRSIEAGPQAPNSYVSLGQLLTADGREDEARAVFDQAQAVVKDSPPGLVQLARALVAEGSLEAAERAARRATELDPRSDFPHALLGNILQQLGRFDEAVISLKRAIDIQPNRVRPYFDLAYCKRLTEPDRPLLDQMGGMLWNGNPSLDDRRLLHYALGKGLDDLKEYDKAIRHFEEANGINRIMLQGREFNPDGQRESFDRIIETFTKDFLTQPAPSASSSELPLLIVGMIRSGTTLVEQIVSSHPEVGAGGELPFLLDRTRGATERMQAGGEPEGNLVEAIAADYVRLLETIAPGKKRVTDKMPHNFVLLGAFHRMFPRGRVIHCRRNPLDNALSIFVTPFQNLVNFACTREDIVAFYRQYARLMKHWREVLPADRFLEIDYEELVADRERVTRQMIAFCGLEWDDRCLHHERSETSIRTPSLWQARQPLYKSSVERWRNYEPWLGALRELETLHLD